MGASSARLLRQLLAEGLVLAALGGAAGLPLAYSGLRFPIAIGPESLVRNHNIQLDRALLFTAAVVLAAPVLAGLPPAWRVLRAEIGRTRAKADAG